MAHYITLIAIIVTSIFAGCDKYPPVYMPEGNEQMTTEPGESNNETVEKTDAQWKRELTAEQYHVLRQKGTEAPFTGKYDKFFKEGTYYCAGCGSVLFESDSKYNSGCGWPAFDKPADADAVTESRDTSHGMIRTEITCAKCGGHLGHVFNDGPQQTTGQRYCINSASLKFEEQKEEGPEK